MRRMKSCVRFAACCGKLGLARLNIGAAVRLLALGRRQGRAGRNYAPVFVTPLRAFCPFRPFVSNRPTLCMR